jgi:hypothetical protein
MDTFETYQRLRRRWKPIEMAPGALPRSGRVPEQRLLSPEIRRRWQRSCGTLLEISLIVLGFSFEGLFIGGRAASGGYQGHVTTRGHG